MSIHIFPGDCTKIIPLFKTAKFDFIFADPPFNIGMWYNGYDDKKSKDEYEDFTYHWVERCWHVSDGVMALHGPDDLTELYAKITSDFGIQRVARIVWYYKFGQCTRYNWINSHCFTTLYKTREDYIWNPEEVLIESDRVKYGDKRIFETKNGGKRVPGTVWEFSRIQGNNEERWNHVSNQIPELYISRLIKAYTNIGSWVLDPFGGTGTTAVVCKALQRNCATIELSEFSCEKIKERLEEGAVRL